jgi:hypothetical protein
MTETEERANGGRYLNVTASLTRCAQAAFGIFVQQQITKVPG